MEQYLRIFTNYEQDNWAEWLSIAEFQFNDKEHSATKYSPFMLNSGRHPWKGMHQKEITNKTAEAFMTRLEKMRNEAELAMKRAAEVMKTQYDRKKKRSRSYREGESVWLETSNLKINRPSKKLAKK